MESIWHPANTHRSAAPALTRGLVLLAWLGEQGGGSLEQLARSTGYPKSSLLRLLQTLEQMGAVSCDPSTKRYTPLVRIMDIAGRQDQHRLFQRQMTELCERLGHSLEAYRWTGQGLMMVNRWEPDSAGVRAVARVGYVRNLCELDCLSLIYRTQINPDYRGRSGCWSWDERAQRVTLCSRDISPRLDEARKQTVLVDPGINPNGVRRYAVWLGSPLALILAVAQVVHPSRPQKSEDIVHQLQALKKGWHSPSESTPTTKTTKDQV